MTAAPVRRQGARCRMRRELCWIVSGEVPPTPQDVQDHKAGGGIVRDAGATRFGSCLSLRCGAIVRAKADRRDRRARLPLPTPRPAAVPARGSTPCGFYAVEMERSVRFITRDWEQDDGGTGRSST